MTLPAGELCNIALGRLCVCKQATGSWQVDSSVGVASPEAWKQMKANEER